MVFLSTPLLIKCRAVRGIFRTSQQVSGGSSRLLSAVVGVMRRLCIVSGMSEGWRRRKRLFVVHEIFSPVPKCGVGSMYDVVSRICVSCPPEASATDASQAEEHSKSKDGMSQKFLIHTPCMHTLWILLVCMLP